MFLSRFAVSVAGVSVFALVAALYLVSPAMYLHVMYAMMKVPAPHPFVDWEWIPSAVLCWSEGVNVYVNNTCYHVWSNLGFNYSPLWLRLIFLRALVPWTVPAGITLCVLFFLSLALLPPARSIRGQTLMLLAALSSATFLCMERGNSDLLLFIIMIVGISLGRYALPFRLAGYALFIVAGLLKFFPFVALILALRERLTILIAVTIVSVASLAALVVAYHQELGWMVQNLPVPSYYTLQLGAADLPGGLGATVAIVLTKTLGFDLDAAQAVGRAVSRIMLPVFAATAIAVAVSLGRRCRLPAAIAALPAAEINGLVVGAALVCGCFFAGQSVLYKGIFLLLPLPSLMTLARQQPMSLARRAIEAACVATVFVLWTPFLESVLFSIRLVTRKMRYSSQLPPAFPVAYLFWFTTELAWWLIITVLLAALGAFIVRTQVWLLFCEVLRLPRRGRDASAFRVSPHS
jgi:hypothetical protein